MNKLTNLLGAAAIIAIAFVFILEFRPATGGTKIIDQGPQCIAEPHGSCIPASHWTAAFRLLGAQRSPEQIKAMGLRQRVADGLIERWALNEDAKRLGITVSDDDVTRELRAGRAHVSMPAALVQPNEPTSVELPVKSPKTKQFDVKTYEKSVRQYTKMSPEDFREYEREELIADRMREIVKARVHISENEAFSEFLRDKSTVILDYAKFDRKFFTDVVVDASPKVLSDWIDKNKDDLDKAWDARKSTFLPECRVTRELYVHFDDGATDDQRAAAKKKADDALARIQKGDAFADVARDVSDLPSATRGGDVGCVGKGRDLKPVEDAIFATDKDKVSNVIETEQGYFIVKVEQIAKDLEAERLGRQQVDRDVFTQKEAERLAAEGAKEVLAAVQGGKSLKDAVQTYIDELKAKKAASGADASDKKAKKDDKKKAADKPADDKKLVTIDNHADRPFVQSTLPFNQGGSPFQGVRPGTDVAHIAFDLQKAGDVPNDIVPLDDGYAVIQLKEKQLATKELWDKTDGSPCAPKFPTCRELYTHELRRAKQQDALVTYTKRLKSSLTAEVVANPLLVTEPKADKNGNAPSPDDDEGSEE